MKTVLIFFLSFFLSGVNAQTLRIGLLWNSNVSSMIFTRGASTYTLSSPNQPSVELSAEDIMSINIINDSIEVRYNNKKIYSALSLQFKTNDSGFFKMRSLVPDIAVKSFTGNLDINLYNRALQLVNSVDLEKYVSAVIESEVGTKSPPEYYKTQAILCRTYALSHLRRHEAEGFGLCDKVHCQAYKGKGRDVPAIIKATEVTEGLILVDEQLNLITAAFHSNCGGATVNSEDVWNKPLPYLRSVQDTFCTSQPNATWKKEMTLLQWTNYLEKCKYPTQDSDMLSASLTFSQTKRGIYLGSDKSKIPLKNMRDDLRLKSTYFSVEKKDSTVVLYGRGYGHGVGLCQEGAIRMAKLGYTYSQILHHYFTKVNIVNRKDIDLFRE